MTIIFVCTGNTCRSPMAEAIGRKLLKEIEIFSAGIFAAEGGEISWLAKSVLEENGYGLPDFRSRRLQGKHLEAADLVLTMSREHKEIISTFFEEKKDHIFTLKGYNGEERFQDIPDPYGGDRGTYLSTFSEIEKEILKLAERLEAREIR